jgi:hypothetical protein
MNRFLNIYFLLFPILGNKGKIYLKSKEKNPLLQIHPTTNETSFGLIF